MEPSWGLIKFSNSDQYWSLPGGDEGGSYRDLSLIMKIFIMVSACMCRYHGIFSELQRSTSLMVLVSTPGHIRDLVPDEIREPYNTYFGRKPRLIHKNCNDNHQNERLPTFPSIQSPTTYIC